MPAKMIHGFILLCGLMFLYSAIATFKTAIQFLKKSERAVAKVVEILEEYDSEESTYMYRPVFKFETSNREEFTYKHEVSSSSFTSWKIGETATLAYNPEYPNEAKMYSYYGIFIWPVILLALSLPLITIGAGYFLAYLILK